MANGLVRLLFCPLARARRRLYSAAVVLPGEAAQTMAASPADKKKTWPLYRRLSALGAAPSGSVARTLNEWVGEGRWLTVRQLMRYVKELRKYRRYEHALEVHHELLDNIQGVLHLHGNVAVIEISNGLAENHYML